MTSASFSFGFSIKVNRLHSNNTVILENASNFYRTRYKLDKIVFLSIFLKPESYLFLLTLSYCIGSNDANGCECGIGKIT